MLSHLLKSLWRKKFKNLMITIEICLIFIVVFAIVVGVFYNVSLYRKPLGFEYADRWSIRLQSTDQQKIDKDTIDYASFKRNLLALPEVESVSFTQCTPYHNRNTYSVVKSIENEKGVGSQFCVSDDQALQTLGISVSEGRWLSAQDEGAAEQAVVISRDIANQLFFKQSALGKILRTSDKRGEPLPPMKVVGILDAYRWYGEYYSSDKLVITRFSPLSMASNATKPLHQIALKLKPGIAKHVEAQLYQRLKETNPRLEYEIRSLVDLREDLLSQKIAVFATPVVIAAFLLLMVAFGLFGVLWQNTTKRIPELGLRRAIGASSVNIYFQIISEQLLLSSLALLVGLIILVQIPLTGAMAKFIQWDTFAYAIAISSLIIYLLSVLCALYPAWAASRLSPTEALHYE
ncbi:MAG: ABC transporter permease [Undibacterium sp.]|nr:ABC transporter permease [Undibacterium sp.]